MEAPYGNTLLATETVEGAQTIVVCEMPAFSLAEAERIQLQLVQLLVRRGRVILYPTSSFFYPDLNQVNIVVQCPSRDRVFLGSECSQG